MSSMFEEERIRKKGKRSRNGPAEEGWIWQPGKRSVRKRTGRSGQTPDFRVTPSHEEEAGAPPHVLKSKSGRGGETAALPNDQRHRIGWRLDSENWTS